MNREPESERRPHLNRLRLSLRNLIALFVCVACVNVSFDADARRRRRRRISKKEKLKRAAAKKLFGQAEKAYNLGQFKRALSLYSKAYEVIELPGFLFNIGQCHRMLRNFERAVFFYRGYLRGGRSIPNKKMVERLIEDSERLLGEQKQAEMERRKAVLRRRVAMLRAKAAAAARATVRKPYEPTQPRKRRKPVYRKWWFWTVLGAAVVAAAAGTTAGVLLGTRSNNGSALPSGSLGTLDRR